MFHLRRVAWALRKLQVPAGDGLVLDVGSGGRPYPRSDVLLDRLTGADHRCGEDMMLDGRHAVFGDAKKMPFKDKAFDFVIASHILEHISEPEVFIKELQRVGKAGYIETPNAIFERLYPHPIHCLEVLLINGELRLYKKKAGVEDTFLGTQRIFKDDPKWLKLFHEAPDMFHVRYFWEGEIDYVVLNPEVSCEWIERINDESSVGGSKQSYMQETRGWREVGQTLLKRWYGFWRARRLKNFKLSSILVCPDCHADLNEADARLTCRACGCSYPMSPVPDFTPHA
jgi:hypothetical protein